MVNKASKGSTFERQICATLSRWWTQDLKEPRTDIFWRTAGSGARASARSKRGRRTANQYGDLCAIDPTGQPFVDLITTEIKRGYNRHTVADLLDKPCKAKTQMYEDWFVKAQCDHERAGSFSWLLIAKRDLREPLVFMPKILEVGLYDAGSRFSYPCLWLTLDKSSGPFDIVGVTFRQFLIGVDPEHIRQLVKEV